ncbi:MAG: D-Ala-D-Ala carboxypeptidase family metallohydrolase [Burkholderiales bacterium]|nr:D-Ala-D-Ala carboxypeptidase family metallohydrolase [Burkholderiales bacterium]
MTARRSPKLSRWYSLARLVASETAAARGIDNTPPPEVVANLRRLARGLDRVRRLLGHPLEISSGYRSPALNAAVGGASGSQHTQGLAVDFCCPGFGAPLAVADAVARSDIDYDTVLLEYGRWVHLSFAPAPRRRLLTIYDDGAGYREGIVDASGRRLA